MISQKSVKMIKGSVTKTVTVGVVTQLVEKYILKNNNDIFNQQWIQGTMATAVGFMVHDLITYRVNDMVKLEGAQAKALADVLYFGTMMVVKEFILAHLNGTEVSTAKFYTIAIALAGFVVYDLFVSERQPKLDDEQSKYAQDSFADSIKSVTAILVSDFLPDQDIEAATLPNVFSLLIALPVFHMVTGPLVGAK